MQIEPMRTASPVSTQPRSPRRLQGEHVFSSTSNGDYCDYSLSQTVSMATDGN